MPSMKHLKDDCLNILARPATRYAGENIGGQSIAASGPSGCLTPVRRERGGGGYVPGKGKAGGLRRSENLVDGESESVEAAARRSGKCTGVKASGSDGRALATRGWSALYPPHNPGPERTYFPSHFLMPSTVLD